MRQNSTSTEESMCSARLPHQSWRLKCSWSTFFLSTPEADGVTSVSWAASCVALTIAFLLVPIQGFFDHPMWVCCLPSPCLTGMESSNDEGWPPAANRQVRPRWSMVRKQQGRLSCYHMICLPISASYPASKVSICLNLRGRL